MWLRISWEWAEPIYHLARGIAKADVEGEPGRKAVLSPLYYTKIAQSKRLNLCQR